EGEELRTHYGNFLKEKSVHIGCLECGHPARSVVGFSHMLANLDEIKTLDLQTILSTNTLVVVCNNCGNVKHYAADTLIRKAE
ncbi:MAG: hypothetical protein ABIV51_12485, partial [Saprospiraceae bacterium]